MTSAVTTKPIEIIDMRGVTYHPCWGCGALAGGHEAHVYYGDFAYGIEHGSCGERIKSILDRSIRALSAIDKNGGDKSTYQAVKKALITTSARILQNRKLNTIKDDKEIRRVVETDGMKAALATFRGISSMDDRAWEKGLEAYGKIMDGPELIQEKLTKEEKSTLAALMLNIKTSEEDREKGRHDAIKSMISQWNEYTRTFQSKKNASIPLYPYCVLCDVVNRYCENSGAKQTIQVLKEIDQEKWDFKLLFLAQEIQDPGYKHITHIVVKYIALRPTATSISQAQKAWEAQCKKVEGKAVALSLDCLEWKNHWVFIDELNCSVSLGEGSKLRKS